MLSVHTSPLHQPGTGDAGGMNVYMRQLARCLAEQDADVDLFTRCGAQGQPQRVDLGPGVRVRNLVAGPRAPLAKEQLPDRLAEFSLSLLRSTDPDRNGRPYDVVHSHYWLSGQVGRIAAAHWRIPLVHTMHTLARVKNAALAEGDTPEPEHRVQGEHRVIGSADRLIANTPAEAEALRSLYGAARTDVVRPGVDLRIFHRGDGRAAARDRLGIPRHAFVPLFAGRIQPLKGPDVLLRAVVELLGMAPGLRRRLLVPVIGGLSGTGTAEPERWHKMCARMGIADVLRFGGAVPQDVLADWYRAADVVVMPSRSESFGLVALEAQACGTPVLAAAVGGLPTAVWDGVTGLLVAGHDPVDYALRLLWWAERPDLVELMGRGAVRHASGLSWERAAKETLDVYRAAREALTPRG
ncbi:D-inositol-3-phosphate glycosyltransferase [Streptomyces oceani]|nr:D-inositol-3-phosphate glycosyltransferase [Streptomyces oceani]